MVKFDASSWRIWIAGRRIHGYAVGWFLVGAGVALIVHDFPDRRVAFRG